MTYSRIAFFERPCNSCGQRQNEQQQHAKQQPHAWVSTTVNRVQAAHCSHDLSGEDRMGEGGSAVRPRIGTDPFFGAKGCPQLQTRPDRNIPRNPISRLEGIMVFWVLGPSARAAYLYV